MKKFQRKAFTLAEVLITLGVIGIVASLTIPVLMQKSQDSAAVSTLKKEDSVLQQAINSAYPNEGNIDAWYQGTDSAAALDAVNAVLSKYLKVLNNCGTASGCLPSGGYKYLSASYASTPPDYDNLTTYSKMQLADGTILIISISLDTTNQYITWITFYVDTNGIKGPNQWGYDLFGLRVRSAQYSKTGQIIEGTSFINVRALMTGDLASGTSSVGCNVHSATLRSATGLDCTTWALYRGNLDYKYCDDLNWDTKATCN